MLILEKPREMLARHVREGRARIAAQEALIIRLNTSGPMSCLPNAFLLLGEMHRYQRRIELQLAQEIAQGRGAGRKQPNQSRLVSSPHSAVLPRF